MEIESVRESGRRSNLRQGGGHRRRSGGHGRAGAGDGKGPWRLRIPLSADDPGDAGRVDVSGRHT